MLAFYVPKKTGAASSSPANQAFRQLYDLSFIISLAMAEAVEWERAALSEVPTPRLVAYEDVLGVREAAVRSSHVTPKPLQ